MNTKKILCAVCAALLLLTLTVTAFAEAAVENGNGDCNHTFVNGICQICGVEGYYEGTSVTYSVAPTYTVTIPAKVTLGESVTVSAENVVVAMGKQVTVKLTATDGDNNAFTLKTQEGTVIAYTVSDGTKTYAVSDIVLSVDPANADRGTTALKFTAAEAAKYAGFYTGIVTFTVSVESALK